MDRASEEDDGRVGEATGEEGGERRGLGRSWVSGVGIVKGVGGGRIGRGVGRGTIVNEGSGDYALRVASKRDGTGIRVRPRRTIRARG